MSKQDTYNCILYESGDKVKEKYGSNETLEIETTEFKYVGMFPILLLKFKDKPIDIGAFSNLYIPVEETIEKYKNGLKYFAEVKINVKEKQIKTGSKIHEKLARQILRANKNILTPADLKPKYIPKGTFSGTPIKKNDEIKN